MDKKFLTAFVLPEYFQIGCFKLRPLCAKSMIALHAVNSPFVVAGKEFGEQDILNFLRICSVDFDGFFKLKKLTWAQKYFFFKMKYWPPFKLRILYLIKIYVEESAASPLVRVKDSKLKTKESVIVDKESLPDLLMLVALLMAKYGMSEKEALELPVGRATCYSLAFAVMEGSDMAVVPEQEEDPEAIKAGIRAHAEKRAEELRLAMANGKIPKRNIKIR